MKAIQYKKSGSLEVLEFLEIRKPKPAAGEVLIKVHAATVTRGDVILRKLHPLLYLPMSLFGIKRNEIPGHEFAGVVAETCHKKGNVVLTVISHENGATV